MVRALLIFHKHLRPVHILDFNWAEMMKRTRILIATLSALLVLSPPESIYQGEKAIAQSRSFCNSDLSRWESLISLRPSQSIQRNLKSRSSYWKVHPIEDAYGDINLDYYSVIINRFPPGMSRTQFLKKVRVSFNDFIDTNNSEFNVYDTDTSIWFSSQPLGALINIDFNLLNSYINPDDGSVVTSQAISTGWTFSTIRTIRDGSHPVSGNRRFGLFRWKGDKYVFYSRGADRTTGILDRALSGLVFSSADKLWRSLQKGVVDYVNQNGGSAQFGRRVSHRCNWDNIKQRYFKPSVSWIN